MLVIVKSSECKNSNYTLFKEIKRRINHVNNFFCLSKSTFFVLNLKHTRVIFKKCLNVFITHLSSQSRNITSDECV